MKVLWIGDAVVNSGFSVVTHNICNQIYKKCDLEIFGILYNGRAKYDYPYHIYPGRNANDIYSFDYAAKVIKDTQPDVVVIFNDDHIIEHYLGLLPNSNSRIVPLFPVNLLPLELERFLVFSSSTYNIPELMTYTKWAKNEVEKINPNLKVNAIYHGVDRSVFAPIPNAKETLNLKDMFVVGNINVNTYRKRLDLFLRGFAKFAKNKGDVRCLLHSTNKDIAYDLPTVIKDLGIAEKVIISNIPKDFPEMNVLYNIMDVNVNTSLGEGFGLSLIEGAACRVPVLCPEHGNLTDIWGEVATYIKTKDVEYIAGTKYNGVVIDVDDMAEKLTMFYEDRNMLATKSEEAYNHAMQDRFNWEKIAENVLKILQSANRGRISYIY